jgi:hypothetical protein
MVLAQLCRLMVIVGITAMAANTGAAVRVLEPPVVLAGNYATWRGRTGSGFQNQANWDSPPTAGATHEGGLAIQNGAASALAYTAKEGSTTFWGQFLVGGYGGANGTLKVTGGTLTVDSPQYEAIIGQLSPGTLTVSGGELNLTGQDTWLGNEAEGRGVIGLSGGTIVLSHNFLISRNKGRGVVEISGGAFIVQGSGGTTFGTSAGPNKIIFAAGAGEFRQTGSGKITFLGSGDAATAYINFVAGSKGKLSLAGVTSRDYFDGLVKRARIKVDDKGVYDPLEAFQYSQDGAQGVYSLKP